MDKRKPDKLRIGSLVRIVVQNHSGINEFNNDLGIVIKFGVRYVYVALSNRKIYNRADCALPCLRHEIELINE